MNKKTKLAFIGIITGLLNGLFGSGGGTVAVPAMEKFLGVSTHKAHATAIAIILPLSMLSAIVYTGKTALDLKTLLLVSIGGMAGGFIGAKLLHKLKAPVIHKVFGIFMIVAALRIII